VGAVGTERGLGAGSSFKSGTHRLQRGEAAVGDGVAVERARVARAYHGLLSAAMARLSLHYAARIAGLLLAARADSGVAVAALMAERDTALDQLRRAILDDRRAALRAVQRRERVGRYHRPTPRTCAYRPAAASGPRVRRSDHSP
jgi:hypothetical protein